MGNYESRAVKLIKEEVLPRLETVESNQKTLRNNQELLIVDVGHIKSYMENAGLHNGTAETVAAILAEGAEAISKRKVNRAFLKQNLGWLPPEVRTFAKVASYTSATVAAIVTIYVWVAPHIHLALALHLP